MYMAYVSLVSLAQTFDQIFCHSRNHLLYNKQQIESLGEKVGFLQEFLEDCDRRGIEVPSDLENQMKNLDLRAEDIIETKLVDDILGKSPHPPILFCQKIEEIIQEFDSMVMRVKEREGVEDDRCSRKNSGTSSSGLPPGGKISGMVGFEKHLIRVMDELTGRQPKRQILTIAGMGGIEYSVREIILRLLHQIKAPFERDYRETTAQSFEELRDDQLGEQLYKSLWDRKYLIVMDDVWSIQVWDEVKMFLPDNGNRSRILVTTRLSDVAHWLSSCSPYKMDFLDEYESWSLLCQVVFGPESYPIEFEDTGKQIARKCKGLPLAIVVIGGLLSKSVITRKYWEYVAQHLSSIVNSENDEHCLNVLYLSFKHLPVHLKPCFLYMGSFPKDGEIRVSQLIKLWVAEGFLKPIVTKSLEEAAEEYLKDLVDRNLILVETRKSNGKMRSCSIHDLLRDLCIKEAHKENFWLVTRASPGINSPVNRRDFEEAPRYVRGRKISIKNARCLVSLERRFDYRSQTYKRAKSASFTRSLFSESAEDPNICFRFSRIDDILNDCSHYSRYIAIRSTLPSHWNLIDIPSSIVLFRNLQTLVVSSCKGAGPINLPFSIWETPHLRHIEIKEEALLLYPPSVLDPDMNMGSQYLHNLQTLSTIRNFRCDKNVLERIPNLKKLKISVPRHNYYQLNNLVHLQLLESLNCRGFGKILLGGQAFPDSIKKLTLNWLKLPWKDMSIIGCLPNLEVLKLRGATYGKVWNTAEEGFLKLKYLLLESLDVCDWETESSHFPRLESLIIRYCEALEEIPLAIAEIPTMKLIELYECGEEANSSAQQIQEEQRSLGNEDLQVRLKLSTAFIDEVV
ncbi:putative late blight resistance protein homolog R1A-10 [Henckelia pumila]|uniref:putative late blight resistance protein homolog R1A-10 n=1 Tax=Henckelia pumila TaxID=405737 RepID=UPI003C6E8204